MRRVDLSKKIYIKPGIEPLLKEVDALIFDVDGVLLDVHRSFWDVILITTRKYLSLKNIRSPFKPLKKHIKLLKLSGGFNNDWDVTSALILISLCYSSGYFFEISELSYEIYKRGGGLQNLEAILKEKIGDKFCELLSLLERPLVERLFKEIYAGKDTFQVYGFEPVYISPSWEGLYKRETVLLSPDDIPPSIRKMGLFTGRTAGETRLALTMTGFISCIPMEFVITADDGLNKPAPEMLKCLAERMKAKRAIYVGDAIDDLRSVPQEDSSILSCIVNKGQQSFFKREGADIIVPETRMLTNLLREERI
ncbi:hypothetical protein H5T87_00640 [bacterium]|nr:hypothetical protein [bacterium]